MGALGRKSEVPDEEYKLYLAKVAESDEDAGVRRIACRLLEELFGEDDVVVKSSRRGEEYLVWMQRFAREHPDPSVRARAEAVLDDERSAR